ncbi:hypothetical protein SAMN05421505_106219 [Sinosporangium album]|uniref:Uncharacterized protein n=1 Tax=Sinosporangium album TaxID=504805 RepID=A0A1G7W6J2_9ACTN|nr:hypothetical protein [Sinosporangium album]SDG67548.1 hypothetical protein SAMN05421505_106219 [Sinosporangium album]
MTTRTTRPSQAAPWRLPMAVLLLFSHLPMVAAFWALLVAVVGLIILGMHTFGTVSASVWDDLASGFPQWALLGTGVVMLRVFLPMHVGHGRTRREFTWHTTLFIVAFTGALAVLLAAGYWLEKALYGAVGWPHMIDPHRFFTDGGQFGLIVWEFWCVLPVWMISGVCLSAAFYRSVNIGLAVVPVALLFAVFGGSGNGTIGVPFVDTALPAQDVSGLASSALSAAVFALGVALAWALIRDIPIRSKAL